MNDAKADVIDENVKKWGHFELHPSSSDYVQTITYKPGWSISETRVLLYKPFIRRFGVNVEG